MKSSPGVLCTKKLMNLIYHQAHDAVFASCKPAAHSHPRLKVGHPVQENVIDSVFSPVKSKLRTEERHKLG